MKRGLLNSFFILFLSFISIFSLNSQNDYRWKLSYDGGIEWIPIENTSHMDHIEMSGSQISTIVHYGVENGELKQKVHLVFPMLRTIPNDTHASLAHEINYTELEKVSINGEPVTERPDKFYIKGILAYRSVINEGISISHQLFPSTDRPLFLDKISIHNSTDQSISIDIPGNRSVQSTDVEKGVYGIYQISVSSTKHGTYVLKAGETLDYALIYSGNKENYLEKYISPEFELTKRNAFIEECFTNLNFESPNPTLNRMFAFAKLRAAESIFDTKGGLMHGPGGGRYYAAIWANDQAEYANPFFPFLGNLNGNESAINSFRHFARYMNPDYEPIPSSIIAEGIDFWNGAGDRGDMAMIAYGAARFALAYGKEETARELWPLLEWCLEYCHRKINEHGVVASDSDELEGRFPAGDANLNTSSLYFDALSSAVRLGEELHIEKSQLDQYSQRAADIEKAIEQYFGAKLSGFDTYRYYDGNDVLRAWISTPLTVGIYTRAEGTIDALFSEKLWTVDGLASASGSTTFWDRATLYALRGVITSGEKKRAMPFLQYYSKRRLLGEHVPYPVEAYPEGNQRHLSAESALYCRIITEGIFGIRPLGFKKFMFNPRLPDDWRMMALRNIKAFDENFDIEILRVRNMLSVRIFNKEKTFFDKMIDQNETILMDLQTD